MRNCAICNNKAGIILSIKTTDEAYICSNCLKKIPRPFKRLQYRSLYDMQTGINHYAKMVDFGFERSFCATASYGRLYLDEIHGILALCDKSKLKKDGTLKEYIADLWPVLSLTDYRIEKELSKDGRSCIVRFEAMLNDYSIALNEIVKEHEDLILVTDEDGTYIEDPLSLRFFRSLLVQTLDHHAKRLEDLQEKYRKASYEKEKEEPAENCAPSADLSEIERAKALFMLGDEFSKSDLKRQRAILLKAFHPDAGNVADAKYTERIIAAYDLLMKEIKN